jgi:hypothetical protein
MSATAGMLWTTSPSDDTRTSSIFCTLKGKRKVQHGRRGEADADADAFCKALPEGLAFYRAGARFMARGTADASVNRCRRRNRECFVLDSEKALQCSSFV